eukprot:1157497-Pelagomonas_calceolata.AAC.10
MHANWCEERVAEASTGAATPRVCCRQFSVFRAGALEGQAQKWGEGGKARYIKLELIWCDELC